MARKNNPFVVSPDHEQLKVLLPALLEHWYGTVSQQVKRLTGRPTEPNREFREHYMDFTLYVLAANNLRQVVEISASRLAPSPAARAATHALQEFDEAWPHLKHIRDILMHGLPTIRRRLGADGLLFRDNAIRLDTGDPTEAVIVDIAEMLPAIQKMYKKVHHAF